MGFVVYCTRFCTHPPMNFIEQTKPNGMDALRIAATRYSALPMPRTSPIATLGAYENKRLGPRDVTYGPRHHPLPIPQILLQKPRGEDEAEGYRQTHSRCEPSFRSGWGVSPAYRCKESPASLEKWN